MTIHWFKFREQIFTLIDQFFDHCIRGTSLRDLNFYYYCKYLIVHRKSGNFLAFCSLLILVKTFYFFLFQYKIISANTILPHTHTPSSNFCDNRVISTERAFIKTCLDTRVYKILFPLKFTRRDYIDSWNIYTFRNLTRLREIRANDLRWKFLSLWGKRVR